VMLWTKEKGGSGHSNQRPRQSGKACQIFTWGWLRLQELVVGMLGEGEGDIHSILVLNDEREMAEGWLVGRAHAPRDDGIREACE
jgi:hypothetical protein